MITPRKISVMKVRSEWLLRRIKEERLKIETGATIPAIPQKPKKKWIENMALRNAGGQ